MILTSIPKSKPSKMYVVSVADKPAKRKKWWQFWRKKGDSAEELIESYFFNMNRYLRKARASELWGIHRPEWENDYWFPNR